MKKLLALLLAAMMLVLVFTACGKTQEATDPGKTTVEQQKKLVVGVVAEPATLDPGAAGFSGANSPLQNAIFSTLIGWDSDALECTPLIAKSWEWIDDVTCRFYLNENVYSQSGHHITAHDVKYTYDRINANPAIGNTITWFDMESSKAVDDYTFDLKMWNPNYNAMSCLSLSVCGITCEEDVNSVGEEAFSRNPIGTGPYKLAEWKSGESLTLTKWDEYWGDEVYYDTIELKVIPDTSARILALQSGDIDFAEQLGSSAVPTLEGDPNVVVVDSEVNQTQTIWFNCDDGPLSDVRVRYALEYAIDKEAVGQSVFMGYGQASYSVFNSVSAQCAMPKNPRTYNPEKAKELLAEAGYADGFEINMACYENTDFANLLQSIAYYWSQIGVNAHIDVMEKGSFFSLIYSDDFDIYCIHTVGANPLNRTASFRTEVSRASGNQSKVANPKIDEIQVLVNAEPDEAKRNDYYKEMAELLYEDAHFITIWDSKYISGAKPGVTSIKLDSISNMQYHLFRGE